MQGVSICIKQEVCPRCKCLYKVCKLSACRVQACACKTRPCMQGTSLQVTSTHAKHKCVQGGSGVLCPQLGQQCHLRAPIGAQGWGHLQHLKQCGVRWKEAKGHPRLPAAGSGEGAGALSEEGGFLYFDDNFPVFGAVRFLVSSSPSVELLHVVDTAIVF